MPPDPALEQSSNGRACDASRFIIRLADPTVGPGSAPRQIATHHMGDITIEHLASRPELLPTIQSWFEAEWPGYYGPGGRGNARRDLLTYSNLSTLPVGLVAFFQGQACGFAALKSEPFPSHAHLHPWAGAAYVQPSLRRQGIGRALLVALEGQAAALGHTRAYCASATSASLLQRCGWKLLELVQHEGEEVGVYEKAL